MSSAIFRPKMATKHVKTEQLSPVKKRFVSPINQRRQPRNQGVSTKFRANLKDFHKYQQSKKGDLGNKKKIQKDRSISYHLGGNSHDPLNLNSLIDRDPDFNTPQASPLALHEDSPIQLYLPKDCTDPLNLKCFPSQDGKEGVITPKKKKKKKKNKNAGNDNDHNIKPESPDACSKDETTETKKKKSHRRKKSKKRKSKGGNDVKKVFPEVAEADTRHDSDSRTVLKVKEEVCVEKSGVQVENVQSVCSEGPPEKKRRIVEDKTSNSSQSADMQSKQPGRRTPKSNFSMSKQKQKGKVFIHGNYNRYYGYRNNNQSEDIRLKSFKKEWFQGKDVLDIGCNTGIVTLAIAKNYEPRVIVGSDIDNSLIRIAKSNIRNYVEKPISSTTIASTQFPISFMLTSGPLAAPVLSSNDLSTCSFPKNVVFKQENYVPPHETALSYQKAMYDTILCLSVTKWVHLNNGDQGLKLMFKKMFKNLRPGGKLILEPQPMSSYKRRKNLTEKIRANYDSIKFKPEQFLDYLLSDEVGFAAFEVLNPQDQTQTGFKRPLYLFTKAVQPVNPTS